MTRSQKYNIREGSASYQADNNSQSQEYSSIELGNMATNSTTSSKIPIMPPKIILTTADRRMHWTWIPLIIAGTFAATFLGVMYGIRNSPVHLYSVGSRPSDRQFSSDNSFRQGRLVIYPKVNEFNYSQIHHYFISMAPQDLDANSNSLRVLTGEYPHQITESPPEPYVHCWLEQPSNKTPCFYDRGWFGRHCSEQNKYGYQITDNDEEVQSCFMVRIEDSGDWVPRNLRPEALTESFSRDFDASFIGFECQALRYNSRKDVTFNRYPVKGFPLQFFPMNKFDSNDYLHPAIMVQVQGIRKGENSTIECWIRSPNAFHLLDNGSFRVTFIWPARDIPNGGTHESQVQSEVSTSVNSYPPHNGKLLPDQNPESSGGGSSEDSVEKEHVGTTEVEFMPAI